MRAAIAALGAALLLSGCGSAAVDSGPDRFAVKHIERFTCVVWSPYDGSGNGSQMECFE